MLEQIKKLVSFAFKAFFALLAIVVGLVVAIALWPSSDAIESPPQKSTAVDERVSAGALASAYEENAVAADAKFKGKRLGILGVADSITTNMFGEAVIVLAEPGARSAIRERVQLTFHDGQKPRIAELRKGYLIAAECVGKGDALSRPIAGDCVIVEALDPRDFKQAAGESNGPARASPQSETAPQSVETLPRSIPREIKPLPLAAGEPYADARAKLLAAGWEPYSSLIAEPCQAGDRRCVGRPDFESCAAGELRRCRYLWSSGDQVRCFVTEAQGDIDVVSSYCAP